MVCENQHTDTNVAKITAFYYFKNIQYSAPNQTPQHPLVRFLQIFIEYSGISALKARYFALQTAVSHQIQL